MTSGGIFFNIFSFAGETNLSGQNRHILTKTLHFLKLHGNGADSMTLKTNFPHFSVTYKLFVRSKIFDKDS
jgi:hypothetical protein